MGDNPEADDDELDGLEEESLLPKVYTHPDLDCYVEQLIAVIGPGFLHALGDKLTELTGDERIGDDMAETLHQALLEMALDIVRGNELAVEDGRREDYKRRLVDEATRLVDEHLEHNRQHEDGGKEEEGLYRDCAPDILKELNQALRGEEGLEELLERRFGQLCDMLSEEQHRALLKKAVSAQSGDPRETREDFIRALAEQEMAYGCLCETGQEAFDKLQALMDAAIMQRSTGRYHQA